MPTKWPFGLARHSLALAQRSLIRIGRTPEGLAGLGWAYVLIGVLIREPGAMQGIAILTLFPLAFGTNMVAPTKMMPTWLQAWVSVNPVTQAMDACRGLLLGGPVAGPLTRTLLRSVAILLVSAPLAVCAYRLRT